MIWVFGETTWKEGEGIFSGVFSSDCLGLSSDLCRVSIWLHTYIGDLFRFWPYQKDLNRASSFNYI